RGCPAPAEIPVHIQQVLWTRRPDAEVAINIKPHFLHSTSKESDRTRRQCPKDHRTRSTDKAGTGRALITKRSFLDSSFKESKLNEGVRITQTLAHCLGTALNVEER